jgi:putative endonuclease
MPFVYVLRSLTTKHLYTGATSDLVVRLAQHNSNQCRSTKNRGPWILIHQEELPTVAEALRRERFLKTGKGRAELQGLIGGPSQPE